MWPVQIYKVAKWQNWEMDMYLFISQTFAIYNMQK